MKKVIAICLTSALLAACSPNGSNNESSTDSFTTTQGTETGNAPAGNSESATQSDSTMRSADSVPNKMYDTGKGNKQVDSSRGGRGQ